MSVTCSICSTINPDPLDLPNPQYCDGCGVELTPQTSDLAGPDAEAASAEPSASEPTFPNPLEVPEPSPNVAAENASKAEPAPQASASTDEEASDAEQNPTSQPGLELTADDPPTDPALESAADPVLEPAPDAAPASVSDPVLEPVSDPISDPAPAPMPSPVSDSDPSADQPPEPSLEPEPASERESASAEVVEDGADSAPPSVPAATIPAANANAAPAYLLIKRHGAVTGERVPLEGERLTVGRFDPSTGPVDIDVTGLPGAEHISRRHAEIYAEAGVWNVRDLGSTNGVFLKPGGEASYSPRLQAPAELADGDELAFGNVVFVFRQE